MRNISMYIEKIFRFIQQFRSKKHLPKKISGPKTVSLNELPASTEAFILFRNEVARTPEGGVAILILAVIKFIEDAEMGRHWLIIATDKNWLSASNSPQAYKGFDLAHSANFHLKQLEQRSYLPYSYVKGTSATNGYKPNGFPYLIETERTMEGGDDLLKVYVHSSGGDTARPVSVRKNDAGVWKAFEYSSVFTGIKPPKSTQSNEATGDF